MGIIFSFVLLFVVITLLWAMARRVLLVWDFDEAGDAVGPRCGKCGYSVLGLPTTTCPECGSDLREVGIVTPGIPQRLRPGARLAIWTLVLCMAAVPLTALLLGTLPVWRDYQMQRVVFVQDKKLNAIVRVTGSSQGFGRGGYADAPPPPRSVTLREDHGGASSDLVVSGPWIGGEYRFHAADGHEVRGKDFGAAAVRAWLAESVKAGQTAPADEVDGRAADIVACVKELPDARGRITWLGLDASHMLAPVTAHPTFVSSSPSVWSWAVIVAFWATLWWAVARRIRWKTRT
jgi:hypothetical protein